MNNEINFDELKVYHKPIKTVWQVVDFNIYKRKHFQKIHSYYAKYNGTIQSISSKSKYFDNEKDALIYLAEQHKKELDVIQNALRIYNITI